MTTLRYAILSCVAAFWAGCGQRADSPSADRRVEVEAPRVSESAPAVSSPAIESFADPETLPIAAHMGEESSVRVAQGESTAASESGESFKSITYDHIKFDMKKGDKFKQRMLTDKIRELFDKNIRIRGYILPTFKQDGIATFVLVRDNKECCFGPGAALFDCIIVDMAAGKTTSYTPRPVTVEGKLTFQKYEDPLQAGELRAIYHLDAVKVK